LAGSPTRSSRSSITTTTAREVGAPPQRSRCYGSKRRCSAITSGRELRRHIEQIDGTRPRNAFTRSSSGNRTGLARNRAWLDGVEATDLGTAEPTNPPGGLSILAVGYEFYSPAVANPAGDAWIDEVTVDPARIGCAQ
jgi:hypothetical protein